MRAAPNQIRPSAMVITRGRRIDSSESTYPGIWGVMIRLHRCYYILDSDYLTNSQVVTIKDVVTAMESYHDAPNPWIRAFARIDPPAPRDDHCAGPYLVGCRAHACVREVALHDCRRAIG